jgi:Protein of unknown function (DUF2924)
MKAGEALMNKADFSQDRTSELAAAIAGLTKLDAAVLKAQWQTLYGSAPPVRISRGLLIGAVAYGLQEQALGGLTPATHRRLLNAAGDPSKKDIPARRELQPGTVVLREWHGVNHQVTVLEGGLEYRGQRYRSLSEVARVITGSRWSGPLFFGLKLRVEA